MEWLLDLGTEDDEDRLAAHLAERGLSIQDVFSAAERPIARRKGERIYLYGRGSGGGPLVVVLERTSAGWRPRTAWPMDVKEQRWWRDQGGE